MGKKSNITPVADDADLSSDFADASDISVDSSAAAPAEPAGKELAAEVGAAESPAGPEAKICCAFIGSALGMPADQAEMRVAKCNAHETEQLLTACGEQNRQMVCAVIANAMNRAAKPNLPLGVPQR
jgi:hypothetical protein